MIKHIIPAALSIGCVISASADVWTYAQCVDYAREHNITLQKARIAEQTNAENLEEAKGQWQPTLDFSTNQGYVNTPWGANKNAYNSSYGFNAGWTAWDGGIRSNTIKRDKLQLERSRLSTDQQFRTLETDLLQVYINLLYARESIAIYESAVKLSKSQAERAKILMDAGKISRVDYAQLNSQYEQDKYNLVNSRSTYDNRRMELKQLLELGIDSEIDPIQIDWTEAQVLAALPPIEESYRLACKTDLQMQGLEIDKSASELDIKIAQAGRSPKIALQAGVGTGYAAPGVNFGTGLKHGLNEQIGLTLSVPILDAKKTKTAVARARLQQLDAQLDIDKRETELAQLVENWYIDTNSAQARYKAAISQLESAQLTDDLTSERFALGYVDPVELLTAHNSLTEARHQILQAKFMAILGQKMLEYYRTAAVSL